jgi:hypothetical protein
MYVRCVSDLGHKPPVSDLRFSVLRGEPLNETAGRKHEQFKSLSGIIHMRTVRCASLPANATDPAHAPITVTELGPTNACSDARCVATLRRSGRSHALYAGTRPRCGRLRPWRLHGRQRRLLQGISRLDRPRAVRLTALLLALCEPPVADRLLRRRSRLRALRR